jgi:hypothetical protein
MDCDEEPCKLGHEPGVRWNAEKKENEKPTSGTWWDDGWVGWGLTDMQRSTSILVVREGVIQLNHAHPKVDCVCGEASPHEPYIYRVEVR